MTTNADRQVPRNNPFANAVGASIFLSRWLQAPLYLGLIVAQGVYVALFWKELAHLVTDFGHLSEYDIMLIVLGLVDVVMIANLLIMVIIGGYETFVSRIKMDDHPDQPEWLSHVNPNVLKVKLAMSIIGISSVHLLKTFIEFGEEGTQLTNDQVMWQTIIHMAFIVSAIGLAWIDQMGARTQAIAAAAHEHRHAEAEAR
ncbi:MAG: TIGR00645 family protein [Solirubrobacteraceae bacterium]|nr:TIGR00645 family protein [Solirubrobacteraceae bacterium]